MTTGSAPEIGILITARDRASSVMGGVRGAAGTLGQSLQGLIGWILRLSVVLGTLQLAFLGIAGIMGLLTAIIALDAVQSFVRFNVAARQARIQLDLLGISLFSAQSLMRLVEETLGRSSAEAFFQNAQAVKALAEITDKDLAVSLIRLQGLLEDTYGGMSPIPFETLKAAAEGSNEAFQSINDTLGITITSLGELEDAINAYPEDTVKKGEADWKQFGETMGEFAAALGKVAAPVWAAIGLSMQTTAGILNAWRLALGSIFGLFTGPLFEGFKWLLGGIFRGDWNADDIKNSWNQWFADFKTFFAEGLFGDLWQEVEDLRALFNDFIELGPEFSWSQIWSTLHGTIKAFWTWLTGLSWVEKWTAKTDSISAVTTAADLLKTGIQWLWDKLTAFINWVFTTSWSEKFSTLKSGLDAIKDAAGWAWDKLQGFWDWVTGISLSDIAGDVLDFFSTWGSRIAGALPIPGYAQGGMVPGPAGAPQLAVVHGGEQIIPAGGGNSSNRPIIIPVYIGERYLGEIITDTFYHNAKFKAGLAPGSIGGGATLIT